MRDDRDEVWDSSPDEPNDSMEHDDWGEEEWEAFLARQDVLHAKYQELYETLHDHPHCGQIIARELRWDLAGDSSEARCEDCPHCESSGEEEGAGGAAGRLGDLPIYRMASEYALAVEHRIELALGAYAGADDDAVEARRSAIDVPARIADGHSLGYDRAFLCGNIVCCRRALADLDASLDGLLALRRRGTLAPAEADALLRQGRELSGAITERVEDLRLRVWWR